MNYRLSTIHARKTYTTDITEIIDLNLVDPLSQLIIELAVTGVGGVTTAHAIACLNKIELVDGSDVLFSLSGYEAEAADIYHNKLMRSNWNPYLTTLDVQRFIGINFGRYLWDPVLAFDPKKFRNPQLKLTLDIDAGGNASVSNKLQVWGAMFDQKAIEPIGFLMHKEVKNYQMAASAHEYTDLPKDYPFRKLFLRCQTAGTEPNALVNKIKLSEDQDKKIIFDHSTEDLFRTIAAINPQLIEQIMFSVGTSAKDVFTTVSARATATFAAWAAAATAGEFASYGSAGGKMSVIHSTTAQNAVAIVAGWLPHATWEIPFGLQDQIEDWYDVSKIGNLRLDVTAESGASSSNTIQVFLQQLRKYGAA